MHKVLGGLRMTQWIKPLSQVTSYKKDLSVTEKGDKKDIMVQIQEKFASEPDLKKNVSYLKILAPAITILMVKLFQPHNLHRLQVVIHKILIHIIIPQIITLIMP